MLVILPFRTKFPGAIMQQLTENLAVYLHLRKAESDNFNFLGKVQTNTTQKKSILYEQVIQNGNHSCLIETLKIKEMILFVSFFIMLICMLLVPFYPLFPPGHCSIYSAHLLVYDNTSVRSFV